MISPLVLTLALARADTPPPRRATLYLSFGGTEVAHGPDNAANHTASCIGEGESFAYPSFTGGVLAHNAIAAEATALLAPYGVRVTTAAPPPHLPHNLILMGGEPEALGVAEDKDGAVCRIDCGDATWSDMGFVFTETSALESPAVAARVAVHEAGHMWGLEHVTGDNLLMGQFSGDGDEVIGMDCSPLDPISKTCPAEHALHCPDGQQSAHAELLALFGTGEPDTTAPEIEILSPRNGDRVAPGTEVLVEARVSDDHPGFGWRYRVPELAWEHIPHTEIASGAALVRETALSIVVPEGIYTLEIEAIDHDLNTATARVELVVEEIEDGPATASCACRSVPGPRPWWWLGLLVLGRVWSRAKPRL